MENHLVKLCPTMYFYPLLILLFSPPSLPHLPLLFFSLTISFSEIVHFQCVRMSDYTGGRVWGGTREHSMLGWNQGGSYGQPPWAYLLLNKYITQKGEKKKGKKRKNIIFIFFIYFMVLTLFNFLGCFFFLSEVTGWRFRGVQGPPHLFFCKWVQGICSLKYNAKIRLEWVNRRVGRGVRKAKIARNGK